MAAINEPNLRVLVAGATGNLGRLVVRELKERNIRVRAMTRHRRDAAELRADDIVACDLETGEGMATAFAGRIDVVFSALGSSLRFRPDGVGTSFHDIDYRLNRALCERASANGVRRFVYVSAFSAPGYADTSYIRAHQAVADCLRDSGMEYGVLRPTPFFSSFLPLLDQARRGRLPLFGYGETFTNPIDDRDLAALAADTIVSSESAQDIAAGGPDMMTRKELGEAIFAAVGKPAKFWRIDENLVRSLPIAPLIGLADRRLGELADYYAKVNLSNSVAPPVGTRRLVDFLAAAVANTDPAPAVERKTWGGQSWSMRFAPLRKR
ncbi:MAG: NAD(P)H-binding protein [Capsulimonadales bacterium]|nr:NAD(P)H-binding protein [Capsulimonadales bacterium]